MKELTIVNGKEVKVIDSREVAEMLGVEHKEVIRKIQGGSKEVGLIPTLESGNFPPTNYFIESSYLDKQNKTRKCYLVTKMGCEMLGNKQQGEKGILFTAKYVERFNKMEEVIQKSPDVLISEAVKSLVDLQREMTERQNKQDEKILKMMDEIKRTNDRFDMFCMLTDQKREMKKLSSLNASLPSIKKVVEGTEISPADANKKLIEKGILNKDKSPTEAAINKGLCEPDYYDGKCYARYTTKGQKEIKKILGIEEVEQTSFDNVITFKK